MGHSVDRLPLSNIANIQINNSMKVEGIRVWHRNTEEDVKAEYTDRPLTEEEKIFCRGTS